jgi:hypothetical protein
MTDHEGMTDLTQQQTLALERLAVRLEDALASANGRTPAAVRAKAYRERRKRRLAELEGRLGPPVPLDREAFQRCLDAKVRAGSVPAMRLWVELDRERAAAALRPAGPFDELRARRDAG